MPGHGRAIGHERERDADWVRMKYQLDHSLRDQVVRDGLGLWFPANDYDVRPTPDPLVWTSGRVI